MYTSDRLHCAAAAAAAKVQAAGVTASATAATPDKETPAVHRTKKHVMCDSCASFGDFYTQWIADWLYAAIADVGLIQLTGGRWLNSLYS